MRAILIDPEKRLLTEIQLKGYREIRAILGCRSFTLGAFLSGSIEKGFDAVYVSDDNLEDQDEPRFWFQIDADHKPPSSFPIAGLGLALGTNAKGAGCDLQISVEELAKRVTFTQRNCGFKSRKIPNGIAVTVDAPLIPQ